MIGRRISITILTAFACLANSGTQQPPRWVLMPSSAAAGIPGYFLGTSKIRETWQVTGVDIEKLESHLTQISQLRSEGGMQGAQIARPENFYRQYFGIVVKKRQLIFINAFCSDFSPSPAWRTQYYVIFDGGACVWRTIYDPATGLFEHLSTNGVG